MRRGAQVSDRVPVPGAAVRPPGPEPRPGALRTAPASHPGPAAHGPGDGGRPAPLGAPAQRGAQPQAHSQVEGSGQGERGCKWQRPLDIATFAADVPEFAAQMAEFAVHVVATQRCGIWTPLEQFFFFTNCCFSGKFRFLLLFRRNHASWFRIFPNVARI